jgi:hypothetical protein
MWALRVSLAAGMLEHLLLGQEKMEQEWEHFHVGFPWCQMIMVRLVETIALLL